MKNVLIRNGKHMRPLRAVLLRYGIGQPDKYDRGLWISKADLPRIQDGMASDPTGQFDYASHGSVLRRIGSAGLP